jgi:hypothetical protein
MLEQQTNNEKNKISENTKKLYLVLSVRQIKQMLKETKKEDGVKVFYYVESPKHPNQLRDIHTHELLKSIQANK